MHRWIVTPLYLSIFYEIALRWMPQGLTDDQSTIVQVMAWCRQATSHYMKQRWPRSMSSYGVSRPQWVNSPFQWDWEYCRGFHDSTVPQSHPSTPWGSPSWPTLDGSSSGTRLATLSGKWLETKGREVNKIECLILTLLNIRQTRKLNYQKEMYLQ